MATKTTGAEFKEFYSDNAWWPEGTWHEDVSVTIDGVIADNADFDCVPDAARIVISDGFVFNKEGDEIGSFEGRFRKWRKQQTTVFLVVEVPIDKIESVWEAIIAAGGKVNGKR